MPSIPRFPSCFLPAVIVLAGCLPAIGMTGAAEPFLPQASAYLTRDSWRQPVAPVRIAAHTWQIGTAGISAVLIKTDAGAVLIDGGVAQASAMLLAHMHELGVEPADLKLILHSHAHADHVGPLTALKRATGATVASNAESAVLLARGGSNDIHFGDDIVFAPLVTDRIVHDGEIVTIGGIQLTVHFTPGHTPGSMSWTWNDVADGKPVRIAYVDSLSAPDYRLIGNPRYPHIIDDYRHTFDVVRTLPCDLLLTPHADGSGWDFASTTNPHPRPMGCQDYADAAASTFEAQLETQREAAR